MDFEKCAVGSIDDFVRTSLGDDYYPKWYSLVPCDPTDGWGASPEDWRTQADGIIQAFESCSGVHIGFDRDEVDKLGNMTLAEFSQYLIERAEESSAKLFAKMASANLRAVTKRHRKLGIRARALATSGTATK